MAGSWQKTNTPGLQTQIDKRTSQARYRVIFRDARQVSTTKTFPTKRLAQAFQAEMRVRRSTGSLPDVSLARRTVSQLYDHSMKTSRARPSTIAWYESRWRNHVEPVIGPRHVGDVRRAELAEFYADIEKEKSLATRRSVQQLVHKLFEVAVDNEWISRNPGDRIPMPAARPREAHFLTAEEVALIAREVPPCYKALVWTLALTGLRIGEAAALRVKNLDGNIRVVENSVEVNGKKIIGQTKTEGSERVVPVPPAAQRALRQHLTEFGDIFNPESFVFTTEERAPIGQNNFRKRIFKPAAERAGITPTPTVHDLRHTAISIMLKHGMSTFEVAKIVGHTDEKMIWKTYGHLYESDLQAKVDRLDEAWQ